MQVNKSLEFFTPVFFDQEEINKLPTLTQLFIKMGQAADVYLSWGEDRKKIKASTLENVKEKISVWIKVVKVASYILAILPLAALVVKAIYKKYCADFIQAQSKASEVSSTSVRENAKTETFVSQDRESEVSSAPVRENAKTETSVSQNEEQDLAPTHHRTRSLSEYFQKYARISKEGSEFITKIDEYHAAQTDKTIHPPLVRRPRFRNVVITTPPPPPFIKSSEDIKNILRRSTEIENKKSLCRILDNKDPLLTKYILAKLDILISYHQKTWEENEVDAAICYPVSLDVFVDIYYYAKKNKIYIATQKFALGIYNEVVRGYDWKTGEEVVCRRRLPERRNESAKDAFEKQFLINREINKLKIPNVIDIKGCLLLENQEIMILEKMEGSELQEILEKGTFIFSDEQKRKLMLSLIRSIQGLHDLGIIHGDVHPKNLFVKTTETGDIINTTLFDFDNSDKYADKSSDEFLRRVKDEIWWMGKFLFKLLFSNEYKGLDDIENTEIRKKLQQLENKNFLETICLEMINVKLTKGQLNVSLKDLIKRLS